MPGTPDITLIGGGIMGLCTALALNEKGHRVTLFEQGPIPNPMGSSVDDHRLIRHPYGAMTGYSRLINPALLAWEHTWSILGRRLYQHTSTLIVATGETQWAEDSLTEMAAIGIEHRRLKPEDLRKIAPTLNPDALDFAAHIDSGGVLFANAIVGALASHLLMRGVTMRTNTPVVDIDPARGSLVTGDGERLRADVIVVAAGPWVRALTDTVGVKPSRQVVIQLEGPEPQHQAWAKMPMVLDIGEHSGIYVVPPVGGTPLKVGDHTISRKGHPDIDEPVTADEIQSLFEACRTRIIGLDTYKISGAKRCFYTVSKDERFVLKRAEKMVIMSGFSGHGFKFGALMGQLAARLATGSDDAQAITSLAAGMVTDLDEIARITKQSRA